MAVSTPNYGLTAIKTDGSLWVWGGNEVRLVTKGYPVPGASYAYTFEQLTQVDTGYKSLASTNNGIIALKKMVACGHGDRVLR